MSASRRHETSPHVSNAQRPCEKAMFKSLCGIGPEARLSLLAV
jgi:hypothetical protein